MELWFNQNSPFARKARILLREKELAGRVKEVSVAVSPVDPNPEVVGLNPLGKIPVLVTDDGQCLYDSRVICEYLDGLHGHARALSMQGPERFSTLQLQALADGICDAAILCRYEEAVRPEALRWNEWVEGQKGKISRALATLDREVEAWPAAFELGQIAVVCAIDYVDFRFPGLGWQVHSPVLAAWHAKARLRPSVAATAPG